MQPPLKVELYRQGEQAASDWLKDQDLRFTTELVAEDILLFTVWIPPERIMETFRFAEVTWQFLPNLFMFITTPSNDPPESFSAV